MQNDVKTGHEEIFKLKEMLEIDGVPFEWSESRKISHLSYPVSGRKRVCSVIQGVGTIGWETGRLEIMGLLTAEERENAIVIGNLTAKDVYSRIMNHFRNVDGEMQMEGA